MSKMLSEGLVCQICMKNGQKTNQKDKYARFLTEAMLKILAKLANPTHSILKTKQVRAQCGTKNLKIHMKQLYYIYLCDLH